MIGFLIASTFNPPQPPVQLGAAGTVLTVQPGGSLAFSSPAAGIVGSSINFSPPAGVIDPAIVGFTTSTGRIKVTLAGNTTFEGFPTGTDGQPLFIMVVAGNFTLTLSHLNGATAQKQIRASVDFSYALNDTAQLFYDGGLSQWILVA